MRDASILRRFDLPACPRPSGRGAPASCRRFGVGGGIPAHRDVAMPGVCAVRLGAEPEDRRDPRRRRNECDEVEAGLVRHVRGASRCHHVHGDASAFELPRVTGGPRFETGLGRPAGMELPAQHGEEARGDVRDAAPALRERRVDDRTGHVPRSREVHGDDPLPGLRRDLLDSDEIDHVVVADDAPPHRAVVDEDVPLPEVGPDVRGLLLALRVARDAGARGEGGFRQSALDRGSPQRISRIEYRSP